jgi:ribonuclease P protein component
MKRRLRALAGQVLPEAGIAGADHVLIGRAGGVERPFAELVADLQRALAKASG